MPSIETDVAENDTGTSPSPATCTAQAAADTTYIRQGAAGMIGGDDNNDQAPLITEVNGRPRRTRPAPLPTLSNAPLPHIYDSDDDNFVAVHRTRPRNFSILPHSSPRPILLGLSLSLALATFWLLDSCKDPVFAALVDGNLSHHQPRAKIFSVMGTLCLVIAMEVASNRRKRRYEQRHVTEEEIMDGGGNWTKMSVGDSLSGNAGYGPQHIYGDTEESGNRIPASIFRAVGASYLAAFATAAIILTRYTEPEDVGQQIDPPVRMEWRVMGYALYFLIESYGSITVACFWAYANSTLTVTAAERYYGTIVALAQLGAIGGSTVAAAKTHDSGQISDMAPLFGVACVGVLLQVAVTEAYATMFPRPMRPEDDEMTAAAEGDVDAMSFDHMKRASGRGAESGGALHLPTGRDNDDIGNEDSPVKSTWSNSLRCSALLQTLAARPSLSGLHLILKHNYVLLILGVSCLYEISLTCLDYEMKLIGLDRFGTDDLEEATAPGFHSYIANTFAQFMGRYGQLTNVLSLLLSYFAFPFLMKTRGLRSTLRIFPALLVFVAILTYLALPMNLPVLFVSVSLLKAMTYSVNDPAKEILYIPTSDEIKFRAKFWIDVVGARIAKALASSINTYAGSADRIVQYGTVPSVVTALGLFAVCYQVGIEFDGLLERGQIVGSGDGDDDENLPNRLDDAYGMIGGEIDTYEAQDDKAIIESLKGRSIVEDNEENKGPSVELVAKLN